MVWWCFDNVNETALYWKTVVLKGVRGVWRRMGVNGSVIFYLT